jgi:hypothetical protein
MIYDLIGNQVHSAPKPHQVKYTEGNNVSQFYTKGNGREVTAVMKALVPDTFTCIQEILASLSQSVSDTFKVSICQKKHFFSRQVWEYADVRNYSGDIIFESKRQIVQKPKPFNIAQVVG